MCGCVAHVYEFMACIYSCDLLLVEFFFFFKSTGDLRGPKEKKVARTRSKVKNSDDDSSPKSAQKKVKLMQT